MLIEVIVLIDYSPRFAVGPRPYLYSTEVSTRTQIRNSERSKPTELAVVDVVASVAAWRNRLLAELGSELRDQLRG
jgi:hypothetical protein